jgi:hypothetical protein
MSLQAPVSYRGYMVRVAATRTDGETYKTTVTPRGMGLTTLKSLQNCARDIIRSRHDVASAEATEYFDELKLEWVPFDAPE